VPSNAVKGIGFDATCSLAVVDAEGNPLSVSPTGKNINCVRFFSEYQH
jgi:ribulose kinase